MFENAHFIYDTLQRMMQKYEKCDFLESSSVHFKKLLDENLEAYIDTSVNYICPTIKDFESSKDIN